MKKLGLCIMVVFCLTTFGHSLAASKKSAPDAAKTSEQSGANGPLTGKIVETMNSGGYTYVQIENSAGKTWVAISQTSVKKGDTVSFAPGAVMDNFRSKTLNRTFDKIIFSGGIISAGAQATESKPSGSKDKVIMTKEKIKVEKSTAANGYTVAEVYKNGANLHEKTVSVRGKVVKVSSGIMNRSWVHIQDGTGDSKKGTNNLVTTSTSDKIPAVDEIVTVSGTCYKDKDFGSGYKYDVIVENSTYTK